jgi:hypothetical protein
MRAVFIIIHIQMRIIIHGWTGTLKRTTGAGVNSVTNYLSVINVSLFVTCFLLWYAEMLKNSLWLNQMK